MTTIDFTACQHLDFSDEFLATKNLINVMGQTKITWQRRNGDMCQFCELRGRINSIVGCLTQETARCSEYEPKLFRIPCDSVDTE